MSEKFPLVELRKRRLDAYDGYAPGYSWLWTKGAGGELPGVERLCGHWIVDADQLPAIATVLKLTPKVAPVAQIELPFPAASRGGAGTLGATRATPVSGRGRASA